MYESIWDWLRGQRTPAMPAQTLEVGREWGALLDPASSELERTAAAYWLAKHDQTQALLEAARHEREQVRRAACYGLRSAVRRAGPGGLAAAATLGALLGGAFEVSAGSVGGTVGVLHSITFAPPSEDLMSALEGFVERTLREIEEETAAAGAGQLREWEPLLPTEHRYQTEAPIVWAVTDRRRALAEACHVLGSLGEQALRASAEQPAATHLVVRACAVLSRLVAMPEPGAAFPSFLNDRAVTGQAAEALLRLCSDGTRTVASSPAPGQPFRAAHVHTWVVPADWQTDGDDNYDALWISHTVAEAVRRLRNLCEGEAATGAHVEVLGLVEGLGAARSESHFAPVV